MSSRAWSVRDASSQAADNRQVGDAAGRRPQRHPQVGSRRELKVARHLRPARKGEARCRDANDGVRLGVQREDTAEDLRIGTETSPPHRVAQHRDVVGSWCLVRALKEVSDLRRDPECREEVSRRLDPVETLGADDVAEVERGAPKCGERLERLRVVAHDAEHGTMRRLLRKPKVGVWIPAPTHDEAIGVAVRQGLEQYRRDDAHHERAGADADREREDAGDRDERCAPELARGMTNDAGNVVHGERSD